METNVGVRRRLYEEEIMGVGEDLRRTTGPTTWRESGNAGVGELHEVPLDTIHEEEEEEEEGEGMATTTEEEEGEEKGDNTPTSGCNRGGIALLIHLARLGAISIGIVLRAIPATSPVVRVLGIIGQILRTIGGKRERFPIPRVHRGRYNASRGVQNLHLY